MNLSLLSGSTIVAPITNWQTPDGQRIVQHLAGRNSDGHLVVLFGHLGGIHTVRIQAVKVADDDGGRETDISPQQAKQWIDYANQVYAVGGIQFLFNPNGPSPDWSILRSTLINNLSGDTPPERNAGNAVAAQYPDKITILFRYGPDPGPTGGGFSSAEYNFVVMPGFPVMRFVVIRI